MTEWEDVTLDVTRLHSKSLSGTIGKGLNHDVDDWVS